MCKYFSEKLYPSSIDNLMKYTVLIVDDVFENIQLLSSILYQKDISIIIAESGRDALGIVAHTLPDLILLDIHMPGMDGFEVCERLKKNPAVNEIPIIFLTGKTQSENIVKGFEAGAVDYITKPFNPSELSVRVLTHLELKRSRDIIVEQNRRLEEQTGRLEWQHRELQELYEFKEQSLSNALQERIKELDCLYGIAELVEKPGITLSEILQGTVELVPAAWQYPDITCVRLVVKEQEFRTVNFRKTRWKQISAIITHGKPGGTLEVCYLEEKPECNEGPFLKEERRLLNAIAERLGKIIERMKAVKSIGEQVRLLNLIFKHSLDSIVLLDKDYNFIRVSETYAQACQIDSSKFPGHNHFEFYPANLKDEFDEVVREKNIYRKFARPFIFPDHPEWGTTYWDLGLVPILDSEGEIELFLFTLKDVSEQKRAEQEIESLAKFPAENPNPVLRVNGDGIVIYANEATQRFLSDWGCMVGADVPEFLRDMVIRTLASQSQQTFDVEYGDRMYTLNLAPISDGGYVNLYARDITERKQQQQLLIQRSKLESLGKLAAGIAHEINQPLAGISMGLDNILLKLSAGKATEEYLQHKIDTLLGHIDRIKHIIEHIRTFSREQASTSIEKVDVNDVCRNALSMLHTQYERHNVNIILNLDDAIGFVVGNTYKLEQVMLNLIANAKDAVDEKENMHEKASFQKCITITTSCNADRIYLDVEDNGTGIPEENQHNIFDPFFTTKDPEHGTGLGLSVSYGIIKEMQGDISVQSQPDEYTLMRISLPGVNVKE